MQKNPRLWMDTPEDTNDMYRKGQSNRRQLLSLALSPESPRPMGTLDMDVPYPHPIRRDPEGFVVYKIPESPGKPDHIAVIRRDRSIHMTMGKLTDDENKVYKRRKTLQQKQRFPRPRCFVPFR